MKKIKIKKQNKITKILIIIIILITITLILLKKISKTITPIIIDYANLEAKNLSSIIINKAISKHITEQIKPEDMYTVTKENTGEIKTIDFNTPLINKFLTETTNSIQSNLKTIEKGNIESLEFQDDIYVNYDKKIIKKGIICYMNTGAISRNVLLANLGPKIPIKLSIVGDATSNVTTNIKNYGINNALIEVYVNIKITEKIIIPYYSKLIEFETKVPVALKIISGTVPNYYTNGKTEETAPLSIPIE